MSKLSENQDAINMLKDAISLYEKELVDKKQNKILGTTKADKLKKKYEDSFGLYEQIEPYIKHLESLCTLPRCAGFGGWPCELNNTIKWITFKHKTEAEQKEIFKKLPKELPKDNDSGYDLNSLSDFKKACELGIEKFIKWYLNNIPKDQTTCEYCGVTQKKCREYLEQVATNGGNKRNRGKTLELERKHSDQGKNLYSEGNCIWICHVCNNAKSDFIRPEDFKPIAQGINRFWQNVLAKEGIGISYLTDFKSIWEKVEKKLNNQK